MHRYTQFMNTHEQVFDEIKNFQGMSATMWMTVPGRLNVRECLNECQLLDTQVGRVSEKSKKNIEGLYANYATMKNRVINQAVYTHPLLNITLERWEAGIKDLMSSMKQPHQV